MIPIRLKRTGRMRSNTRLLGAASRCYTATRASRALRRAWPLMPLTTYMRFIVWSTIAVFAYLSEAVGKALACTLRPRGLAKGSGLCAAGCDPPYELGAVDYLRRTLPVCGAPNTSPAVTMLIWRSMSAIRRCCISPTSTTAVCGWLARAVQQVGIG